MEPIVTPAEMARIDAEAPEPVDLLIDRAGWAAARAALGLLPRRYGSRVLVLAGKGNNGNDGRVAARYLARSGIRCRVEGPTYQPSLRERDELDLVVDAAYGTGFRGGYEPPDVGDVPVLAIDIPSGVDGLTGRAEGRVLAAVATVTFGALKPGLVLEPGRTLAGTVTVAGLGLDCSTGIRTWHLGPADLHRWPAPGPEAHKWQRACWVIGGHAAMLGAPSLAAAGAARGGAGYVTVSIPGSEASGPPLPVEAVVRRLPPRWGAEVVASQHRHGALVVGPGLPVDLVTQAEVLEVVAGTGDRPLVLDGGALDAVAGDPGVLARRTVPAVLTPHDGELRRLLGHDPGPDRIATARRLAADVGAVVLSKGPTTVAAHPDGRVLVSTAGDQRLATAGTGDVLAGLVGAGLAGGLEPLEAAALAAELHGRAARLGPERGLVAGDLPALVARWRSAPTSAATGAAPTPAVLQPGGG